MKNKNIKNIYIFFTKGYMKTIYSKIRLYNIFLKIFISLTFITIILFSKSKTLFGKPSTSEINTQQKINYKLKLYINLNKLFLDLENVVGYPNSNSSINYDIISYLTLKDSLNRLLDQFSIYLDNYAISNRKRVCQSNLCILNHALSIYNLSSLTTKILNINDLKQHNLLPCDVLCPSDGKYKITLENTSNTYLNQPTSAIKDTSSSNSSKISELNVICTIHGSLENIKEESKQVQKSLLLIPANLALLKNIYDEKVKIKRNNYKFIASSLQLLILNIIPLEAHLYIKGHFNINDTYNYIYKIFKYIFGTYPVFYKKNLNFVECKFNMESYIPNSLLYFKITSNAIYMAALDKNKFFQGPNTFIKYLSKDTKNENKDKLLYLSINNNVILESLLKFAPHAELEKTYFRQIKNIELLVNKSNLNIRISLLSQQISDKIIQIIHSKIKHIRNTIETENKKFPNLANTINFIKRLGIALDKARENIYVYLEKLDINLIWLIINFIDIWNLVKTK